MSIDRATHDVGNDRADAGAPLSASSRDVRSPVVGAGPDGPLADAAPAPVTALRWRMPDSPGRIRRSDIELSTRSSGGRSRLTLNGAGGAVGSVTVGASEGPAAEVTDLEVDAASRGRGLGQDLVNAAAREGERLGKSSVVLDAQDRGSGRLDRWYESLGFDNLGPGPHGYTRFAAPTRILRTTRPLVQRMEMRETTEESTKKANARSYAGSEPSKRNRRSSGHYRNVEVYEKFGEFIQERAAIDTAVAQKKLFSGSRDDVSWSSGFPSAFWADREVAPGMWQCAVHRPAICEQPAPAPHHHALEIGHKHGFYTTVGENVDTRTVCDGTSHWQVMLHGEVVEANENDANLEPQCGSCNRDVRQQAKDDRGKGKYQPERSGPCPGPGCGEVKIAEL